MGMVCSGELRSNQTTQRTLFDAIYSPLSVGDIVMARSTKYQVENFDNDWYRGRNYNNMPQSPRLTQCGLWQLRQVFVKASDSGLG
jgi:hypothetical protein